MDVGTTVILVALVNVALALALLIQARLNVRPPGMRLWAAGQSLIAAGLIISAFRGTSLTGKIAIPVWQTTTITGFVLLYVGILRFFGRRERWAPLITLMAALTLWSCFFTFVVFLVPPRGAAIYACAAALMIACARAVHRFADPAVRASAGFLRSVFAALAAIYLLLAFVQGARWDSPQGMFANSPIYTTAYVATVCGTVLWVVGLISMVNERLQARISAQAETMTRIFETSPDCAIISRLADGVIINVNEGFTRLTGYRREEAVGRSSLEMGLWAVPAERKRLLAQLRPTGVSENVPVVLRRKDGSTLECVLSASALTLEGTPHVISLTRDVTEQRALEARLTHDAETDALTGVANRRHFLSQAEREITRAARARRELCVAVIDIDGFKQINDVSGHAAGDAALVHFADVAQRCTRDVDTLGRLGGDEFGLLLPNTGTEEAYTVVERIRQDLLAEPVPQLELDTPLVITISAGVADFRASAESLRDAIAHADSALYEAKAHGRNRTIVARVAANG
ncbi:MAG: GGDEF domain-containing protein [Actinobacteria bacterium]|nr:GGDEF domain-containing protein [Actinomycetota bacterium]MCB8996113.1 GGDEF domain-containing protein [Actinomycetota bacterium]HRY10760.1 sensor domain-containing diguanylate cyclase [Candidatus Nanopelagicales bacterium]